MSKSILARTGAGTCLRLVICEWRLVASAAPQSRERFEFAQAKSPITPELGKGILKDLRRCGEAKPVKSSSPNELWPNWRAFRPGFEGGEPKRLKINCFSYMTGENRVQIFFNSVPSMNWTDDGQGVAPGPLWQTFSYWEGSFNPSQCAPFLGVRRLCHSIMRDSVSEETKSR
jgi:hypothetical protein